MKTVDLSEARTTLAELVTLVKAGAEVILTDGNTPIARLVPISAAPSRVPGLHAGAIWTSDDFDEPLTDAFWLGEHEDPP